MEYFGEEEKSSQSFVMRMGKADAEKCSRILERGADSPIWGERTRISGERLFGRVEKIVCGIGDL
jgi:hypothetical protein